MQPGLLMAGAAGDCLILGGVSRLFVGITCLDNIKVKFCMYLEPGEFTLL